jgi:hypothetical protein
MNPLPQLQIASEFALFVIKLLVRCVGLLLCLHGAVAYVLHRQRRRDDQRLVQRLARTGFQQHATHARVQGQLRQLHAQGRQLVRVVHRAQFIEQLVAVGNGAARGALQEWKVLDDAQMQRLHPQNHASQRAAQDFRIGKPVTPGKVFIVVETNANAVGDASAPPRALVGGGSG